jgi:hypothetical protein
MNCDRCGKKFAKESLVENHKNQCSSKCWTNYRALLEAEEQARTDAQPSTSHSTPLPSPSTPPSLEVDMEFPPLIPSSPPKVNMELDDIDVALPEFYTEFFPGASERFGPGDTFLDLFDKDEYAETRQRNLYYPFASQAEWELASFLLRSGLSRIAIDQFLNLQMVCMMASIRV